MGTSTLLPFLQHQDPQRSEQAIVVFDEMPKATSRVQVHPVRVMSGGRPEVVYGLIEGLTAALRPHVGGRTTTKPYSQQLMDAFVSFVGDEGALHGISVAVQKDPDTMAFLTKLWSPVGFGVFGFNTRGMCDVRSVSRYGSYLTGSRQPIHDEFVHILRTPALTEAFLSMRIRAFDWVVKTALAPAYVSAQKARIEEVRERVSRIDGEGTEFSYSYPLGMARSRSQNPGPVASW